MISALIENRFSLTPSHKLRNRTTELEHGNSLLRMENDIMGEHLKGLYEALNNLVFRKGIEDPMQFEVTKIATMSIRFIQATNDYTAQMEGNVNELDVMKTDFAESITMRTDIKTQLERLSLASKERIKVLSGQNKLLSEERDKLLQDNLKLTKTYKDLVEEHDKTRQRIKQYIKKSRLVGQVEEKQCKSCQKTFVDAENYNWSCKTHRSEYSGDLWWCCGKAERNAPGCKISKHMSRDEEDDDYQRKNEEEEQIDKFMRCSVIFKSELQRNRPRAERLP